MRLPSFMRKSIQPSGTRTSGALESLWTDGAPDIRFTQLDGDIKADVVIVGAGITGITTAYLLAGTGKDIVVIEDGFLGSGETGRTTAHLTAVLDKRYSEISSMHGEHDAFLAYESHSKAIDLIESISNSEKIDCDFERLDAYLFLHPSDHRDTLENEMDAANDIGIFAELVDKACLPFNTGISIRFPQQAQFHPLKYLRGLANAAKKNGVRIFTQTKAEKVLEDGVRTESGHKIAAKHIVIATHSPVKGAQIFFKEVPFRSYVVASKIPKNSIEPGLYWDTGDQKSENHAYHYIRVQKEQGHDVLIIGGEDHVTGRGNPEECFENLEKWVKEHFHIGNIDYRWSGQILEPSDKLAFIGRSPWHDFNLYIATGYSGNGMTYGTIAAMILSDLISGRENKWAHIYDPSRLAIKAAPQMAHDSLVPLAQMAAGWIKGGNIESTDELEPGQGGIMDRMAIYKDEKGKVHAFSASCPHMGCMVGWNPAERSWDCPCHGSRFTSMGEMINGPAIQGLKEVEIREDEKIEKRTRP